MSAETTHTLYRFFNADGTLLYVGRTIDARNRWRAHEKVALWFDDVATVTRAKYETAEELDAAERDAIIAERPRHNIILNWSRHLVADAQTDSPPEPEPDIFGIDETADILRVSRSTVENLIRDGQLESVKIGHRRLVRSEAIDEFIARLRRAS